MEYCPPLLTTIPWNTVPLCLPPSHGILSPSAYHHPMEYCPPLLTTIPRNTVPLCLPPSHGILSPSAYHRPMEYCPPLLTTFPWNTVNLCLPPSHGILSPSAYHHPMEYCPPLLTTVTRNTVPLCLPPSRGIPSFSSAGEQWSFPDVPGRSIPVKRPPCKMLGVVVSALRLVGWVSVHCEIPILMCSFHLTERQHVRHSKQIHSWACSWDVKAPTNPPNQPSTNQPANPLLYMHITHYTVSRSPPRQPVRVRHGGYRDNGSQVIRRHPRRLGPGRKVSASRRTVPRGRGTLCLHRATVTPLVAGVHCVCTQHR